jgi:hypothetical protein
MVALSTTHAGGTGVATPHPVPLSESRALLVEVVEAITAVYDAAHLQQCVYLGQEFRLLRGRRYWFAPSGATGLPYSHILEDHIGELVDWGVLTSEPSRVSGRSPVLRVCYERFTPPARAGNVLLQIGALTGLSRDEVATLAGAVFQLSRQGRHPVQRRFHAALRTLLQAHDESGQERALGAVERICAVCTQLSGAPPRELAPAYAS